MLTASHPPSSSHMQSGATRQYHWGLHLLPGGAHIFLVSLAPDFEQSVGNTWGGGLAFANVGRFHIIVCYQTLVHEVDGPATGQKCTPQFFCAEVKALRSGCQRVSEAFEQNSLDGILITNFAKNFNNGIAPALPILKVAQNFSLLFSMTPCLLPGSQGDGAYLSAPILLPPPSSATEPKKRMPNLPLPALSNSQELPVARSAICCFLACWSRLGFCPLGRSEAVLRAACWHPHTLEFGAGSRHWVETRRFAKRHRQCESHCQGSDGLGPINI